MGGARLMEYMQDNHEILIVQTEPRRDGNGSDHVIKKNYCMYQNLQIKYNAKVIIISLIEPIIEDTQWQGALIPDDITVTIYVDGQEVGTVDLIAGQGEFDFSADSEEYDIMVTAPLCELAQIKVVV